MSYYTKEDATLIGGSVSGSLYRDMKPLIVLNQTSISQSTRPKGCESVVGEDAELMIHVFGEIIIKDLCETPKRNDVDSKTKLDIEKAQLIAEGKTSSRYYKRCFYKNEEFTKEFNENFDFYNPTSLELRVEDDINKIIVEYQNNGKKFNARLKNLEDIINFKIKKGEPVPTKSELYKIFKVWCQNLLEKGVKCKKM